MSEKKELQKMYHSQNISTRKNIRQIDLNFSQQFPQMKNEKSFKKSDINILVVGPKQSGKTSLLKTMNYAYNGYLNTVVQTKQLGNSLYSQIQVKKGKKSVIQGLTKVREIDEKIGIYGFECVSKIEVKNCLQKYARAMELLSTKGFGCLKQSINQQSTAMTVCLVCISMLQKISIEELNSIRLFLSNLEENKVHYMIIGTKLDGILNKFENEEMETQKMVYVDEWCSFIMKELGIKDRSQIMCLQNYSCFQKQKIINSEVVNFYALNLLQKCIKKSEEYELEKKKLGKKSFWLCSC